MSRVGLVGKMRSLQIVTKGNGAPLVLIPGLQGRWEYMAPAVDALARSFRVVTFALCGERTSGLRFDRSLGLDNFADQVAAALDELRIDRAVICGVSFGGVVALRFAATRPDRTIALVLASTPPPIWRLRRRHEVYARVPWIFGPLFLLETPFRLRTELMRTFPERRARLQFGFRQLRTLLRAPVSVVRMAERGRLLARLNLAADCQRVASPTLVVTGDPGLDHVVPTSGASEYLRLVPGARGAVVERTGHLGTITCPDAFAAVVSRFVAEVTSGARAVS